MKKTEKLIKNIINIVSEIAKSLRNQIKIGKKRVKEIVEIVGKFSYTITDGPSGAKVPKSEIALKFRKLGNKSL